MAEFFTWNKIINNFKREQGDEVTDFLFSTSRLLRLDHNYAIILVDELSYSILKDPNTVFHQDLLKKLQMAMSPNLKLKFVTSQSQADGIIPVDTIQELDLYTNVSVTPQKLTDVTESKSSIDLDVNHNDEQLHIEVTDPVVQAHENTWNYEDTNLKKTMTFDNYFYSYDNQKIIQSCKQVIHDVVNNENHITFNPIFIYGSSGIGKTHIVSALGNKIFTDKPNAKILFKNATEFLNDYTSSFKGGLDTDKLAKFKELYFNLDVFIIDDIQMLRTKEGSLNEFFSVFEHLRNNNKCVIITSDVPPKELNFEERLLTRFLSGLVEPIQFPDSDTKTQIFKFHASKINLNIEESAISIFIDSSSSVRELLGYINSIKLEVLTEPDAFNNIYTEARAIQSVNKSTGNIQQMTSKDISKIICDYFEITESELRTKSRKRILVKARNFCVYFYKSKLKMTHIAIAQDLGMKDHTNSVKIYKKFDLFKQKNEKDFNLLSQKINNKK